MQKYFDLSQLTFAEESPPTTADTHCTTPSLTALELPERDIDTEILPLIINLYRSGDRELRKIALTRLREIQHSKLAKKYLQQIAAAENIE